MSEDVFFNIRGKELLLDQVLVEFNEMPIFFVCKCEEQYFISSCADMDNERYLVARIDLKNLSKMLHGKLAMRDLILSEYDFWDITVGEDITKDIVIEKNVNTISVDELPFEGTYLKLATKELEKYAKRIDKILEDSYLKNDGYSCIFNGSIMAHVDIIKEQMQIELQDINISANMIRERQYYLEYECIFEKKVSNKNIDFSAKSVKLATNVEKSDKRPFAA